MKDTDKKILIVEDDKIVSKVLEWRLTTMGYSVAGKAATGQDAITLTNETRPDAIFRDISLQGDLDGIETAKSIQEKFTIPIIFLTAHSDTTILQRIFPLKPADFITKPFTDDDLRVALRLSID
jgi:CheY-like chemotaxis protein